MAKHPKHTTKKKFVQCRVQVNKDSIKRDSVDGVEHITITSFTLPDNIVMNGGLYPADEINASFQTLERTLAPVEHPMDTAGQFLSASDPVSINNFYAGAYNVNVSKDKGRIKIDKVINVQEAMKTERGKRLLDRINELETSKTPRPIHTSVGVFLSPEFLGEAKTNADGLEYDWIARDMVFDHDAILLDSVGAAQPHQGVGIGVNAEGQKFEVESFTLDVNVDGQSQDELRHEIMDALERSAITGVHWIEDIFDTEVIFTTESGLFTVPYSVDEDGRVTIMGIPTPVERKVTFIPKQNTKDENMKQIIVNALTAAGVEVDGLDDDQLLAAYNTMLAANAAAGTDDGDDEDDGEGENLNANASELETAVANAIKPLTDQVTALQTQINASSDEERGKLADIVGNSDKFPGMTAEIAKKLDIDELKGMAVNCTAAHGVDSTFIPNAEDGVTIKTEAPE